MGQTSAVAYYAADVPTSALHAAIAIRCHWHIENRVHCTRYVTFQEDQSRIRQQPSALARLRSLAYNILWRNQTSTFSQNQYATTLAGVDTSLKWKFS